MLRVLSILIATGCASSVRTMDPPASVARLPHNPLITLTSSASIGDDINGPSIIRVPDWVEHPLGRYYLYFAHHMGDHIRMAYADSIGGPWKIYEPGVLDVRDTAFFRPGPTAPADAATFHQVDRKNAPRVFATHIASPEVRVDPDGKRLLMWFHGWWTDGQPWPATSPEANAWVQEHGYGQFTQLAESSDGIHFHVLPAITKESFLRVISHDGQLYGMARLGKLMRSTDGTSFQVGPDAFRDGPYAARVRHVALLLRGATLHVFFTAIEDAPERIMHSMIELAGDWTTWRASPPVEVLKPQTDYECAQLPVASSERGEAVGRARQLRDPAIVEDDGRLFLLYSVCGEQGIAAAELPRL